MFFKFQKHPAEPDKRLRLYLAVGLGLIANIIAVSYYLHTLSVDGYLPAPFPPNKYDTFMDLFNPLFWSFNDDRYTEWRSVYPPIVFLFLRWLSNLFDLSAFGLAGEPALIRDHAEALLQVLIVSYLLIPLAVISTRPWQDFKFLEKILMYFFLIASPPMLFALERGNLIILAPCFLAIILLSRGLLRLVMIGLLINIKPYFAVLLLVYALKARWRELWSGIIITGCTFLLSGLFLDENFMSMLGNIFNFGGSQDLGVGDVITFPSSISSFAFVLRTIDSGQWQYLASIFAYFIDVVKVIALLSIIIMIWQKRDFCSEELIVAFMVIIISNMGVSVGGYSLILYYPIIPIISQQLNGRGIIVGVFLLYLPWDLIPVISTELGRQPLYVAGDTAVVNWELGLGSVTKPILNLVVLYNVAQMLRYIPTKKRSMSFLRDSGARLHFGASL